MRAFRRQQAAGPVHRNAEGNRRAQPSAHHHVPHVPAQLPRTAPYFRVVNPDPQQFVLKPNFRQTQSKNDPKSMILNPLLFEVRAWTAAKSAVSIIIEINNLIRNNYPYQRIQDQGYQAWGNRQMQSILPIFPQNTQSPRLNRASSAGNNSLTKKQSQREMRSAPSRRID